MAWQIIKGLSGDMAFWTLVFTAFCFFGRGSGCINYLWMGILIGSYFYSFRPMKTLYKWCALVVIASEILAKVGI